MFAYKIINIKNTVISIILLLLPVSSYCSVLTSQPRLIDGTGDLYGARYSMETDGEYTKSDVVPSGVRYLGVGNFGYHIGALGAVAVTPGEKTSDAVDRFFQKNGRPARHTAYISRVNGDSYNCFRLLFFTDINSSGAGYVQDASCAQIPIEPVTTCDFKFDNLYYVFIGSPGDMNGMSKTSNMVISCSGAATVRLQTKNDIKLGNLVARLSVYGTSLINSVTVDYRSGDLFIPLNVTLRGSGDATAGEFLGSTVVILNIE